MAEVGSFFFVMPSVALAFFMIWMLAKTGLAPREIRVRKPTFLEVAASVVVVVVSGIGVWFFLSVVPQSFWEVFPQPSGTVELLYHLLFGILPVVLALRFFGGGLKSVRLTAANWRFSAILGVCASLITLIPTVIAAPELIGIAAGFNWLLYSVSIFGMFSEELMIRGFLQTRMEGLLGSRRGIFLAALASQLTHLPTRILSDGLAPDLALVNVVFTILPALLFGYIAWRSDNLLGSTIFHVFYNLPSDLLT